MSTDSDRHGLPTTRDVQKPTVSNPVPDVSALAPTMQAHEGAFEDEETVRLQLPSIAESEGFDRRYQNRAVLGAGGMGYVRLCRDRRIGRDVAVKLIRPDVSNDAEMRVRFEREARVQGQLEHPSIVPVYDLATTADGAYFTMKRVRGHTLEKIVEELARGTTDFVERYTVRKLLSAFGQAALAVAFAHARGVIHRDLKPANIMLGDFGEVYVLDWGLAKLADESDLATGDVAAPAPTSRAGRGETAVGIVMGTAGYMAPEQARGETAKFGPATDVYALGAILFEILALESLHPFASAEEAIASTLRGGDMRPSMRAPQRAIPPELDAICVRALALEPSDRYASVRAMVDEIERFLEGHRDLERRRELASEHVATAVRARNAGTAEGRAEAIRELNRALALEPSNVQVLEELKRLLLTPPAEPPPGAKRALERSNEIERRATAREGVASFLVWVLLAPLLIPSGILSWTTAGGAGLLAFAASLMSLYLWKRTAPISNVSAFVLLAISSAAIGCLAFYLGPFVLVPGIAAQNTLVFAAHAQPGRWRLATIAVGVLVILVPLVLEVVHAVPPSFAFRDGTFVVLPRMVAFPPAATLVLLLIGTIASVVVPCVVVSRLFDQVHEAKLKLFTHLWHLNQLVPEATADAPRGASAAVTLPRA
jgi:serine/threonine-protein kinase